MAAYKLKPNVFMAWQVLLRKVAAIDGFSGADNKEQQILKSMVRCGIVIRLMRGHYRAADNWQQMLESMRPASLMPPATAAADAYASAPCSQPQDYQQSGLEDMAFRWSRGGERLQISTANRDGWFNLRRADVLPIAASLNITPAECYLLLCSIATKSKARRV